MIASKRLKWKKDLRPTSEGTLLDEDRPRVGRCTGTLTRVCEIDYLLLNYVSEMADEEERHEPGA